MMRGSFIGISDEMTKFCLNDSIPHVPSQVPTRFSLQRIWVLENHPSPTLASLLLLPLV